MKDKENANVQVWQWRESKTVKRQDELVLEDQIVATLRWEGWASTVAYGASAQGRWVLDRPRILSRDVEVRSADSGRLVAVYMPGWLDAGGELEFTDGRVLHWSADNFWRTRWILASVMGEVWMSFEDTSGFLKTSALVRGCSSSLRTCEWALLAILGWYLMALTRQDTAAAVAAAGVAAI
jgi:hypothetical protein